MKEVYGGQRTVLIRVNMTKQMILGLNHLGHFSVFGMNLKKKIMALAILESIYFWNETEAYPYLKHIFLI